MYAALEIADFSLQALLRLKPQFRGEPVALLSGAGRRAVVAHANDLARGVEAGMTGAQALAVCPALQILSCSEQAEHEASALLLAEAWTLSPRVEATAPGLCTVDLTGADPERWRDQVTAVRTRLAAHGLRIKTGTGPTALVARYASREAQTDLWVHDARAFLFPLPLSLLGLLPDEERLFSDLGLRTLGSLTAFPRGALTSRLGQRGEELWAKAAGEWISPLTPAPWPVRYFFRIELEEAIETVEPLLFIVKRACERLAAEVGQFGGGTNRLALVLTLDDEKIHARDFELPEPTARAEFLFAVLDHHLSALTTEAAIVGLALEVFPARRLEQQEGLFATGLRDATQFFSTLGRLAAVVGSGNVGTPKRADTHLPDSVVLEPPATHVPARINPLQPEAHGLLLRRCRPPVPATVELTDAHPSFLVSSLIQGAVNVLRRPHWANGGWWQPEPWTREEWDVQVGNGLYRLLHVPEGWFIEGIYD